MPTVPIHDFNRELKTLGIPTQQAPIGYAHALHDGSDWTVYPQIFKTGKIFSSDLLAGWNIGSIEVQNDLVIVNVTMQNSASPFAASPITNATHKLVFASNVTDIQEFERNIMSVLE